MFTLKSASKKFEDKNLPNDAIMWMLFICFIVSIITAIEVIVHYTLVIGLWLSILAGLISFYVVLQILSLIGFFILDRFITLYKRK